MSDADAALPAPDARRPNRWLPLCPVVSGVLFAYALPPHQATAWLAWVALVPLLYAARHLQRTLWAAGAGLVTMLIAGLVQMGMAGWNAEGFSRNYALAPFIWLSWVLACVAVAAQLDRRAQNRNGGAWWVLIVAGTGVVAEWLTGFTPLPVGIALTQANNLPLLQLASITGIWGVSFLLYLVNAAVANLLTSARATRGIYVRVGLAVALLMAATVGGGYQQVRRARAGQSNPSASVLDVAAVQDFGGPETAPGDPDAQKLLERVTAADPNYNAKSTPDAANLMQQAAQGGAKLIVGTENSFGAAFRPDNPQDELRRLARAKATYLVVGHEMTDHTLPNTRPFNCATLIGPDGPRATHHKIHLFLGEMQAMQAGRDATVADTPLGKIGLLICFDSCYTGPTRQAVQQGARLIALPNYDPPTPHGILHHLHTALMPFRAVENNVAYVRADPNGLSEIVQPWGEVVAQAPLYQNQIVRAPVRLGDGQGTLFTRWGDWLPITACAILLTYAGCCLPHRKSAPPVEKPSVAK